MRLGWILKLFIAMHLSPLKIQVPVVIFEAAVNFLIWALLILTVHMIMILPLTWLTHLGVMTKRVLRVTGIFTLLPVMFTPLAETTTLLASGVVGPVIKTRHTSAEGL